MKVCIPEVSIKIPKLPFRGKGIFFIPFLWSFLLAAMIVTGCGKRMETHSETAWDILQRMNQENQISDEQLRELEKQIGPELLSKTVHTTTISDTTFLMEVDGRSFMVDLNTNPDSQQTTLSVNDRKITFGPRNPASEDNLRKASASPTFSPASSFLARDDEEQRRILEGLVGVVLEGNGEDPLEDSLGLSVGDLIDLGYEEDRKKSRNILYGTLLLNMLRKRKKENPDKPFVALYSFGNSVDLLTNQRSSMNTDENERQNNKKAARGRATVNPCWKFNLSFEPLAWRCHQNLWCLNGWMKADHTFQKIIESDENQ